jgi:hypothetical protein
MKYIFEILGSCIDTFIDFILCSIRPIYKDDSCDSNNNDNDDSTYVNLIHQHPVILL